ncbi:MAG: hypothetical protein RL011_2338 [Pseudomonadota bacterium]|jgi:hypothetical protein
MRNFSIFVSSIVGVALLHGCGVNASSKSESKRSAGTGQVKPTMTSVTANSGLESQAGGSEGDQVVADSELHISQAYLTARLAEAEAAQASKEIAPVAEATGITAEAKPQPVTNSDALATAQSKIDEAFAAKMKQYPGALSAVESEFIRGQLNLFVQQSAAKDTAAATATWNGITSRLNKIKASRQQSGLALADHQMATADRYAEYGYRRGGLLTTLVRAVGRVLSVGVRLVAEVVSVAVPAVIETAAELVDSVFYILI